MLESLTIFTPGGLILYQYCSVPSLLQADEDTASNTRRVLNSQLLERILLDPSKSSTKNYHITDGVTLSWLQCKDYIIVAMYPDIMFEGPRQYLKQWAENLLQQTAKEYELYYQQSSAATATAVSSDVNNSNRTNLLRPDPTLFDKTFRVLLQLSKTTQKQAAAPNPTAAATVLTTDNFETGKSKGKKEKMRNWHDGNAAVTPQAMAALDMSSPPPPPQQQGNGATGGGTVEQDGHERALKEARAAYLPTDQEIAAAQNDDTITMTDSAVAVSQSSWMTGLFQQLMGNKVLTASDLEKPIKRMEELLEQKNVAEHIAREICAAVKQQLIGKKLNSLYSVQTAVQQALEGTLTKLLHRAGSIDLLRNVLQKRGDGSLLASFGARNKRPYVITVMGINGIGKTTTLAKLAYYFTQHGCHPLLVAGDTFRSGAVEQLRVHADCLSIPLFSQGYSKDPSAVAAAAIEQAISQNNDVVLVDTAGRMQNNIPLMKALGKLVTENKPDCCLLVCEALVGHDGVSQYQMFRQAAGRVDGLILTKFDTVDTKMGACLTLTHECGAPIVFLGVGQKYHHLKQLDVPTVIKSLFT